GGGGDCGYTFEVGKQYLVYGYDSKAGGRIGTGICTRTRPLSEAADDLKFLRAVSDLPPGATIYGLAQRYTVDLEKHGAREPAGPIEGALVVATSGGSRQEVMTGGDGRYRLSGLAPGKYTVRVTLPEKLSPFEQRVVEVHDRGCAEVNISAVTDGRVAGRLLDARGLPLKGKSVDLLPIGRDGKPLPRLWEFTEDDGSFIYKQLPPGRYILAVNTFDAPDEDMPYRKTFYPSTADESAAEVINVGEGQHLSGIEFRLPPTLAPREMTGTVVWSDGSPVAGAEVSYTEVVSGRLVHLGLKTDDDGRFKLQGYEGLRYRVAATIPSDPDWEPDSGRGVELLTAPEVEVSPTAQTAPLRLVIELRDDRARKTQGVGPNRDPSPAGKKRKRP
ncbi:MAG: carboxypeptidase regulatory-like domain-containing protein, partial [Pyrinomonadaceae bacterium]